jgi:hypothetical protein
MNALLTVPKENRQFARFIFGNPVTLPGHTAPVVPKPFNPDTGDDSALRN